MDGLDKTSKAVRPIYIIADIKIGANLSLYILFTNIMDSETKELMTELDVQALCLQTRLIEQDFKIYTHQMMTDGNSLNIFIK